VTIGGDLTVGRIGYGAMQPNAAHLTENLAAAHISLAEDEVDTITALATESD
jgi:hypothetical protein